MTALRPYQHKLIADILTAFEDGTRSVVATAPCGAGKSLAFSAIAKRAAEQGNKTVIVCHRDALISQASNKLRDIGVEHRIIAPKHADGPAMVYVASVNTLIRRLQHYHFDLIIADEGHHAVSNSWVKVFDAYPKAWIIGFTASPIRLGTQGLDAVYQKLVLGPSILDLIADGYLTEPDTYGPVHELDLSGIKSMAGDYDARALAEHLDKPRITGDAVSQYAKLCPGAPAVVFCVSIRHAEAVSSAFLAAGFRAAVIHGKLDLATIRARIAGLSDGSVQVLVAVDIVSEGTDIPAVACAINLRPTRSLGLHIQQAGRALRPVYAPGFPLDTRAGRLAAIAAGPKPRAIILDHAGNCFRHMTVDEPHEWSLAGRKRRASAPAMSLTQCPDCLRPHRPATACPHCGHIYASAPPREPVTAAGTLSKVDKLALRRARKGQERDCKTLEELAELGRSRGYQYARRWAEIRWHYLGRSW